MKFTSRRTGTAAIVLVILLGGCQERDSPEPQVGAGSAQSGSLTEQNTETEVLEEASPQTLNELGQTSSEGLNELEQESLAERRVEVTPFAMAELWPTAANEARGIVYFIQPQFGEGAYVIAEFEETPEGPHGLHIHEFGDCTASDASSAGGHFNPLDQAHGGRNDPQSHMGDLGNIIADEFNLATMDFYDNQLSFEGDTSVIGKAVVLHSGEDDLESQPSGDSGERIACGVIMLRAPDAQDQNLGRP